MTLFLERFRKAINIWVYLPRIVRLFWDACPLATFFQTLLALLPRLLPLASLWVTKLIVDRIIDQRTDNALWLIGVFVLLTGLTTASNRIWFAIYVYTRNRLPIHATVILQEKINALKGIALFEDPAFHDALENARRGPGRLGGMLNVLGGLFAYICELASIAILMYRFHALVPLIAFIAATPRAVLQSIFSAEEWHASRFSAPEARRMEYYSELVTGREHAKEVRLFGLGNTFISAYRDAFSLLFGRLQRIRLRRTRWNGLAAFVSVCGTGGVYVFLAVHAAMGALTLGDLVLYTGLLFTLHRTLMHTSGSINNIHKHLQDVSMFLDFLDLKCPLAALSKGRRKKTPGPLSKGIEFQDVTFSYPGTDRATLAHLCFTIAPEETLALVGSNGAGKTTIAKLLTRLYDPTEGRILLHGIDLREYDVHDLRERFSVVLQDFMHYHLTVRENIGFGQIDCLEDEARIRKAAERGQAAEVIEQLPKGLDTVLGREFPEGVEISGGEWQKVAIARGFMRQAEILILDEPTAALDVKSEYALYQKFAEIVRGRTALFISHRLSTVRMADRIVVVEKGQMIEEGTRESLMAEEGQYARLFAMQAERYRS